MDVPEEKKVRAMVVKVFTDPWEFLRLFHRVYEVKIRPKLFS